FLHSLFSGKDRDLKIQRQRVLYRGLTFIQAENHPSIIGNSDDIPIQNLCTYQFPTVYTLKDITGKGIGSNIRTCIKKFTDQIRPCYYHQNHHAY
ncbi:hypothetical protein, partial [Bacteroides faecis]|uniref:hypothetical protein n=1 Tax=Bacteroides faecis TaxID=674529 RepID=UPI00356216CA